MKYSQSPKEVENGWEQDPRAVEAQLVDALVHFSGAQVLEIGGGDGRLTKHFAARSTNTVLIDPEMSELATASEELSICVPGKVSLHNAQAEHLPYAADTFDVVVFSWSL